MGKTEYRIRENGGRLSITLPQKVALYLDILDQDGNLIIECIKYEVDRDENGPYAIIRPYEPNKGHLIND
ncbi:hypothetical protein [Methanolobus sp. ZRKC5]|uniref:hypothetical protein n=1 Tax=unclassified Methanolobus TaxID=2629569 RepID=UPI00313B4888